MPQISIEDHLFCRCKQCDSENIQVIRNYFPNAIMYPIGLALLVLTGLQPLPIKMMCHDCQMKFYGSGIHH